MKLQDESERGFEASKLLENKIFAESVNNLQESIIDKWRIAHRLIDAVFFWQANHCERSYLAESMRRQLPAEYR